jgi:hypothetical protein
MDVQQNTIPFPGVVLIKNIYSLKYSGSKQDLVASGLFKDTWFPGERGNKMTVARIEGQEVFTTGFSPSEFESIEITRHDRSCKLFHAKVCFLWEITQEKENEKKIPEARKNSMELALMWINRLPYSEQRFKRIVARYLDGWNSIETDSMVYKRGGYSMTKETLEKYNAAVANLSDVVMNGSINFSEDDHLKARLDLTQEAFDRHLAIYYAESDRAKQFEIFKLEVESQLDLAALTGSDQDSLEINTLAA